jgi:hypothetical protein
MVMKSFTRMKMIVVTIACVSAVVSADEEEKSAESPQRNSQFRSPYAKRTFFGVGCQSNGDCKVLSVVDGGPGQLAGLKVGDVVSRFGNAKVDDFAHLRALIAKGMTGDEVTLKILRDGRPLVLTAKLINWQLARPLLIRRRGTIRGNIVLVGGQFSFNGPSKIESPTFAHTEKSTLTAELADSYPTWLYIKGNASLDGTLQIKLDGLQPSFGQSFEIITVTGTLIGRFKKLDLPKLPKGLVWKVVYDDIRAGADFDGDGEIDITLLVAKEGSVR